MQSHRVHLRFMDVLYHNVIFICSNGYFSWMNLFSLIVQMMRSLELGFNNNNNDIYFFYSSSLTASLLNALYSVIIINNKNIKIKNEDKKYIIYYIQYINR